MTRNDLSLFIYQGSSPMGILGFGIGRSNLYMNVCASEEESVDNLRNDKDLEPGVLYSLISRIPIKYLDALVARKSPEFSTPVPKTTSPGGKKQFICNLKLAADRFLENEKDKEVFNKLAIKMESNYGNKVYDEGRTSQRHRSLRGPSRTKRSNR